MANSIAQKWLVVIALFCGSNLSYSQMDPRIQMPYGLGNVWILYLNQYESFRFVYIDTNYVIDSIKYSVLTYHAKYSGPKSKSGNESIPYFYSRVREDGYYVERLDSTYSQPNHEWIHWKENPQIGDRWENEPLEGAVYSWQYKILDKAYLPIFNTWDTIYALKITNFPSPYELIANYSKRFGIVSATAEFETTFLQGCVINGIVYGDTSFFATDVEDEGGIVNEYRLEQNFPNPFNPETIISYHLKEKGFVSLKVYDVLGKEVATLVSTFQEAGRYNVKLNAGNLSSGVYIYTLKANDFISTKKLILIK